METSAYHLRDCWLKQASQTYAQEEENDSHLGRTEMRGKQMFWEEVQNLKKTKKKTNDSYTKLNHQENNQILQNLSQKHQVREL